MSAESQARVQRTRKGSEGAGEVFLKQKILMLSGMGALRTGTLKALLFSVKKLRITFAHI